MPELTPLLCLTHRRPAATWGNRFQEEGRNIGALTQNPGVFKLAAALVAAWPTPCHLHSQFCPGSSTHTILDDGKSSERGMAL